MCTVAGWCAECPTGQFRCDSGQCVDGRRKCDGQPDCDDASDEHNCCQLLFLLRIVSFS